jgi:RND family efflux transporter MFP subunit
VPPKIATWKTIGLVSARLGLVMVGLGWEVAFAGEMACVIKPYMEVSVGPPVEGIIQTVKVDRGDWVTKGQILVTLEASVEEATVALAKAKADAEATIKSTQAKVGFSTRKLERAMELYKSSSIAKHEVDEAQTEKVVAEMEYLEAVENKRIAELEWQRATAALDLHRIHSPLTGVVVERLLSPGELARQTPILKLAQIDPLRVEVFAPLTWLGKLKPGMKAEVHTGHSEAVHSAKVTVVNEVVDSASGTFGVRLEMPNPNNKLPAGLSCTVNFQVTR